ncbi:HET-domain-containing protein [Acephala macrosclerotiorum]|nr:HET-domain-containing protein [Acephala macrosclerotiorum]
MSDPPNRSLERPNSGHSDDEWETTTDKDAEDPQDEGHPHQGAETDAADLDRRLSPLCKSCRTMLNQLPSVECGTDFHLTTLEALQKQAASGCHLCQHILFYYPSSEWSYYPHGLKYRKSFDFNFSPNHSFLLKLGGRKVIHFFRMPQHTLDLQNGTPTGEDLPRARAANSRNIEEIPWLKSGGAKAKFWLQDCLTHNECNAINRRGFFLPSRLVCIDNESPPGLRLVLKETVEPSAQYITLSHCWGPLDQPYKLLKQNCVEMQRNINYHELPKTFQHAVLVTQSLDTSYLWIDSLCIIQDCPTDWRDESSMMGDVYSHGRCNICATSASESSQGLFLGRDRPTAPEVRVSLHQGQVAAAATWVAIPPRSWAKNVGGSQLLSRAWVVQERVLSRCNLHFTSTQLFWECSKGTSCEYIIGAFLPRDDLLFQREKEVLSMPCPDTSGKMGSITDYDLQKKWLDITGFYSKQALTKNTDRLVALSGIASRFSEVRGFQLSKLGMTNHSRYLAGLWDFNVVTQLLWCAMRVSGNPEGLPLGIISTGPEKSPINTLLQAGHGRPSTAGCCQCVLPTP